MKTCGYQRHNNKTKNKMGITEKGMIAN